MNTSATDQLGNRRSRKILFVVMALCLAALLLWVFSVLLRWLIAAQEWVVLLNDIDHRMPPHSERFFTNEDGIRSSREASDAREEDFNIIVLGDSFMYGFLLTHDSFPAPARLQQRLREHFGREDVNVWNFGWTTSSPILQLRLLQDLGPKYHPDLVLVALDMSDYRDDYFYRHMIAGEGVYGLAKQYPRLMYVYKQLLTELEPWVDWHRQVWGYSARPGYFVATQPLAQNRHLFDALYDSLNQMAMYCRDELHVPFVVFIPPRHWQYTDQESPQSWENGSFEALGPYALENYKYFDEKRAQTPYPLISLLDDFKNAGVYPTTFEKDSHWNKHGAELAAELMFNHLLAMDYLSDPGGDGARPDARTGNTSPQSP